MKTKPLISVIIPTYNSRETIVRCLNSVFDQIGLGRDFELDIIVADNASTDDTLGLVEKYWPSVRVLRSDVNTGGPNAGRNKGLDSSRGDYICFLDSDDTWAHGKLIAQLAYIRFTPIVTTGYKTVDSDGVVELRHCNGGARYQTTNQVFLSKLRKDNKEGCYITSIMIWSELCDVLFEEPYGGLDFDYLLRLYEGRGSFHIGTPLVTRYIMDTGVSQDKEYRRNAFRQAFSSVYYAHHYSDKYPEDVKVGISNAESSMGRFYYKIGDMKSARKYFHLTKPKDLFLYLTSFFGYKIVLRHFRVFG